MADRKAVTWYGVATERCPTFKPRRGSQATRRIRAARQYLLDALANNAGKARIFRCETRSEARSVTYANAAGFEIEEES